MKEEVKRWWNQAKRDLDNAKYNFKGKRYKEASFFCQQSVEKALKALLLKKSRRLIKIHDLVKLGKLVNLKDNFLKDCERLTYVYIETRYPNISNRQYKQEESKEDIKITKNILKWIKKNLE